MKKQNEEIEQIQVNEASNAGVIPEELPLEFIGSGDVAGMHFKQVYKDDFGFIYCVNNKRHEVFERVVTAKAKFDKDKGHLVATDEMKVRYPKSESFGFSAKSAGSFQDAMEKLELLKKRKKLMTVESE